MIKRFFSDETGLELSDRSSSSVDRAGNRSRVPASRHQHRGQDHRSRQYREITDLDQKRSAPLLPALAIFSSEGDFEMIRNFLKEESGLELSEYAVAAALIALVTVAAFQLLGANITTKINDLANNVK